MRIIKRIAQAELRYLLYSPIAWVVLICYLLLGSWKFLSPLLHFATVQDIEITNNPNWLGAGRSLTTNLFMNAIAVLSQHLHLFIPLLTMGAIGREMSSGSMALLSSSPIRTREVVFGKFLGLTYFSLLLHATLALLLITGYLCVEKAEGAWNFSVLLSFFLASCAYIAIGLFISCLTSYQIIAGIGTFVVLIALEKAGTLFQHYDFIRDITWFLSMEGRTTFLKRGLINSRDILYFILVVVLFVGLSLIKMNSLVASLKKSTLWGRYFLLTVTILILGYFSSRPGYIAYLDVTRDQRNTIDSATQAVIKQLDGSPVEVTLYVNLAQATIGFAMPAKRNQYVWSFWEKYLRFYPNINLKYDYYYNLTPEQAELAKMFYGDRTIEQVAAISAKMHKFDMNKVKPPKVLDSVIDLKSESYSVIMHLKYKGREEFLRTFFTVDNWPYEMNLSGAIQRLVSDTIPTVSFTTGHFERSPFDNEFRGHGMHSADKSEFNALINLGVNVDTLSLDQEVDLSKTNVLVVADPRKALTEDEKKHFLQYLGRGGNAIIYGEPYKGAIVNELINELGLHLEEGALVLPRQHVESDAFTARMTPTGNHMAKEPVMQRFQKLGDRTAWANFSGTSVLSFTSDKGFDIEPIVVIQTQARKKMEGLLHQDTLATNLLVEADKLHTDSYGGKTLGRPKTPKPKNDTSKLTKKSKRVGVEDIWIEKTLFLKDSADPIYAPSEGDYKLEEYVLGVKLTRKVGGKEQRIVVAADADFMSAYYGNGGSISLGLYSWLLNNQYPVYTKYVVPTDVRLTISKPTSIMIYYTYVFIIPGFLLLAGSVLLIRRYRK